MTSAIADEQLASLEGFGGDLLRPDDDGYEVARHAYNGLIDKRPALVARCHGEADIVAAVAFAREAGLDVSIRGGGHSVAGRCLVDGGIVIDLSPLTGIFVDPEARVARVQPGVSWGELNRETQLHGLAVTGGLISTTGVAGLTLGGGLGWLMPKYGLATDNLLSARVVTADGRTVTASESENSDLFWGLRGGGGSFGVVSSFEFQLHPVGPLIIGGLVAHPIDAAEEFLRFYRDFAAGSSDDLMTFAVLTHAPDGSGAKLAVCIACHVGEPGQAEEDIRPLREFGTPAVVELGPMPYTALNSMLDGGYPTGSLNYWKSGFLSEFSDAVIGEALERFAVCPSPMTSVLFEHFHGAVTRVPVEGTAVPHREPGYNYAITSVWADPASTDENIEWTREAFEAMEPFLTGRRYVNYLADDDVGDAPAQAAFGPNVARLAEVRATYDPTGLFRQGANVPPGSAS